MPSVYESYTYDQLKELPDDQKITALKELKTIYPDNKDLAKHLDTAHIAISNMVGKYLEGKSVGRKKMTEEEKAQAKEQRKLKKQAEEAKAQQQIQQEQQEEVQSEDKVVTTLPEIKNEESNTTTPITQSIQPKTNSFSIKLEKNLTGEEATARLNGIANSLLKDNTYKISLVIEEVEEA